MPSASEMQRLFDEAIDAETEGRAPRTHVHPNGEMYDPSAKRDEPTAKRDELLISRDVLQQLLRHLNAHARSHLNGNTLDSYQLAAGIENMLRA